MLALRTYIYSFDRWALRRSQRLPGSARPVFQGLTRLGHPAASVVVLAVAVFAAPATSSRALAAMGLLVLPLASVLKLMFRRLRPQTAQSLGLSSYSFPSGHTYGATVAGSVTWLVWSSNELGVIGIGALMVVFVLGVGWSRVVVGAHHASDVVAGWLLGLAVLALLQLSWVVLTCMQ
jgi:membrane-associated phospholipid phosphatase